MKLRIPTFALPSRATRSSMEPLPICLLCLISKERKSPMSATYRPTPEVDPLQPTRCSHADIEEVVLATCRPSTAGWRQIDQTSGVPKEAGIDQKYFCRTTSNVVQLGIHRGFWPTESSRYRAVRAGWHRSGIERGRRWGADRPSSNELAEGLSSQVGEIEGNIRHAQFREIIRFLPNQLAAPGDAVPDFDALCEPCSGRVLAVVDA